MSELESIYAITEFPKFEDFIYGLILNSKVWKNSRLLHFTDA